MLRSALFCTLSAVFLLLPGAAIADTDAGANAAAPPPDPQPEAGSDTSAVAAQLEEEIGRLEKELGPYDRQLGEQLLSLGLAYQAADHHDKASEVLNRALHLKRVNDGLHDLGQVPVLQELIESNIATKNWDELDRNYQLLLFVHRRNYEESDPRFLPIVDQMGRWKLQAYREHLLKQEGATTIREAEHLFGDNVRLLEDQLGETDPRLIEPLYGKALTNYEIMKLEAKRPLDSFRTGPSSFSRITYRQVCRAVPTRAGPRAQCFSVPVMTSDGGAAFINQQRQKDLSIEQRLYAAKRALLRIVEIHEAHPELSAKSHAYALMHLGDWHMLYDQRGTAIKLYKRAYALLAGDASNEDEISKLFGAPASVPSLRLAVEAVREKLAADDTEEGFVKVSFDVSSSGKPRNVSIIEESQTQRVYSARRAKEYVRTSKYRPRFENGEPVDTPGVKVKIPLRLLTSDPSDA